MQNLTRFLDYYGERRSAAAAAVGERVRRSAAFLSAKSASSVREQLRSREAALNEVNATIESLERQIDQLRCRLEYDSHQR